MKNKLAAVFLYAFHAVAPLLFLLVAGYLLKEKGFLPPAFLIAGDRLCFWFGLPAMLFVSIYDSPGLSAISWRIIGYFLAAMLVIFFLSFVISGRLIPNPKQRGAVFQCGFHANFVSIGFPLVAALGGQDAVSLATVASIFTSILFNTLAVTGLGMSVRVREHVWVQAAKTARRIAGNPAILGSLAGFLALCIREIMPAASDGTLIFCLRRDLPSLYRSLQYVSQMTPPLLLLIIGGGFQFQQSGLVRKQIAVGVILRLVAAPLTGIGLAWLLSRGGLLTLTPMEYSVMVALFATPAAVSSALLAREMGCDGELALQLTVWTNLLSIPTIFLIVVLLRGSSLL